MSHVLGGGQSVGGDGAAAVSRLPSRIATACSPRRIVATGTVPSKEDPTYANVQAGTGQASYTEGGRQLSRLYRQDAPALELRGVPVYRKEW